MRVGIELRLPDGSQHELSTGGLIGRLSSADLRLDDPRISEAHALVSLRGCRLVMMGLRGALRVGRTRMEQVELTVGQNIELANGFVVVVVGVKLPDTMLALDGLGGPPVRFESEVATVYADPFRMEPGFDIEGPLHVSADGDGWVAHTNGQSIELHEGVELNVGGRTLTIVELPLKGMDRTVRQLDRQRPMKLVARYDTVHIYRDRTEPIILTGMSAKIVTELVRYASPTPWEWVARELFGSIPRASARMRWDRNLKTLRRKLREGAIRGDLVFCDGHGNVELVMGQQDVVVDES